LQTANSQNTNNNSSTHRVIALWNRLGDSALGRHLFNFLLARAVPYSGSIKAEVLSLQPGHVLIALKDRRAVRNHLNCIHAIALANLGELASGMAMLSAISADTRAIVVQLEIEYLKKARGRLVAEGKAKPPAVITERVNTIVEAEIKDAEGDIVSRLKVHWLLSPQANKDGKNQ
jgi:acyl-coenzyme A thioesterase PaaI-like protein